MLGLGIDIGTSGVRTAVVDAQGKLLSSARANHHEQADASVDARLWWHAVGDCMDAQVNALQSISLSPGDITDAAIDGTSGTMVIVDENLDPVTPALMYNSSGFDAEAQLIERHAETGSITRGANSALARFLHLQSIDTGLRGSHLLHQADYILANFLGRAAGSDENNVLKLGYDPGTGLWPAWFEAAGVRTALLPMVHRVGATCGKICETAARRWGLSPALRFHAGTTDSIAAFMASGADQLGDAVTSLGTTLAVKLLSDVRVDDLERGIYAHKIGDRWLVGGASNTGGGVLAGHFTPAELAELSAWIDPAQPTGLDYYPLLKPGERFPVNDPDYPPRLSPRPDDDAHFLQGMLEAIARIEAEAYHALIDLGAPEPRRIFTAGGGAKNAVWTQIRSRIVGWPLAEGGAEEASIGVARLAISEP